MTNSRSLYLYQLQGTVVLKQAFQAPPSSKYAGQKYYRLKIALVDHSLKTIQVFKNKLENPSIWTALQAAKHGEFSGQQYVFHCRNIRGYYHLVDWEELAQKKEVSP